MITQGMALADTPILQGMAEFIVSPSYLSWAIGEQVAQQIQFEMQASPVEFEDK